MKIASKITKALPVTVEIAKNQDEFLTIPAHINCGITAFAYELSDEGLIKVNASGKIYIQLLTGNGDMQPINVQVNEDDFDGAFAGNVGFMIDRGYLNREVYIEAGDKVKYSDNNNPLTFIVKKTDDDFIYDQSEKAIDRINLIVVEKWYRIQADASSN